MLIIKENVVTKFEKPIIEITKRKILIVDDDDFCRGLLFEVLKDDHYCKVVSTAEQALLTLKQEKFDLVLTDIRMPRKNGLELLSDIRNLHPEMLVVVMTGYAGLDSTVEALRLHAFDFLSKPIDCDTLNETVERALLQVALNEENQKFEEEIREAMASRTDQVRVLFNVVFQNYRNLLMETAESLEYRGVRKDGHIQRLIAFAVRLGEELGLADIELMTLEQGILLYNFNKIAAPDEVLLEKHVFNSEEWKTIFQKETRKSKFIEDFKVFSMAQKVADMIDCLPTETGNNDLLETDKNILLLSRIALFTNSLCKELEENWGGLKKDLAMNYSLQIIHDRIEGFSDPQILKAFIKITKIEWMYLYIDAGKYLDSFEERFRRAFYMSVVV